jgi:hypothetical protein
MTRKIFATRMLFASLLGTGLALLEAGAPAAGAAQPPPVDLRRVDSAEVNGRPMSRVIIQPNGWGTNPQSAIKDLDRVMGFYSDLPGFRRDRYYKVIEIGRGKFQADGRCSYLAPRRPGRTH